MCSLIKFNDKEVLSVCLSDMLTGQSRLYVKQSSMKIPMLRYLYHYSEATVDWILCT